MLSRALQNSEFQRLIVFPLEITASSSECIVRVQFRCCDEFFFFYFHVRNSIFNLATKRQWNRLFFSLFLFSVDSIFFG